MLLSVFAVAVAAEPPSVDEPLASKTKSKKDLALVVAVEDYTALPDAPGATLDAKAIAGFFATTRGLKEVRSLQDPTTEELASAITTAAKDARRGGTLWIYFAGNGGLDEKKRRVLYGKDGGGGVVLDEAVAAAGDSKARTVVFIVDAGFGGVSRTGETVGTRRTPPALAQPELDKVTVWAASTGGDAPYYYPKAAHGLFSWLVAGALRGWADGATGGSANGEVTLEEAQAFVEKQMKAVGGRSLQPVKETRADWAAFSLVKGVSEAGPDDDAWSDLATAERNRRVTEAQKKLLTEASAKWMEIDVATATAGPTTEATLKAYIEQYDVATVQVDGVVVAVVVPEVATARKRLDDQARAAAKATGKKRKKKQKKVVEAPPPPDNSEIAPCLDLIKLEPAAMTGGLSDAHIQCLEKRISIEAKQTTRDKVSRVLMANADGKGDLAEWMRLAERHLEQIDRSDPDICFRYALQLSRSGEVQDMDDVLTWIEYALENKQRWEGPTFVSRVYNLYRVRAETATRLWEEAEDAYVADRNEENGTAAERARGVAKMVAKEWLDYGRVTEQATERALQLCESASGSVDYCAAPPSDEEKPSE